MRQRADKMRVVAMAAGVAGLVGLQPWAGAAGVPSAAKFLTQPLVNDIYTADPSAHVFNGKIFIYPSHDIDAGVKPDDLGSHFAMRDYHVFSMDSIEGSTGKVVDRRVQGEVGISSTTTRRSRAVRPTCATSKLPN